MDVASVILMLVVLLVLARIGARLFARFGMPGLIGEIIIGILIANISFDGTSLLTLLDIDMGNVNIIPSIEASDNYDVLEVFAEIGVIFLLFSVGLETKVKDLFAVGKTAMLTATMGVIIPFIFGFVLIMVYDGNMHHALFLAAAMVATSVGITARVIKDMKVLETLESRIIIGAAVIDDVLGMIVLAIVMGMAGGEELSVLSISVTVFKAAAFVLLMLALAYWVVPRIYKYFDEMHKRKVAETGEAHSSVNKLILAIIVCFGFSWAADMIGLATIIGAFLGGMLLADYAWEWDLEGKIESITTLFISFFFVNVGMQVDLESCASVTAIVLATIVIFLAVISKYIGCGLGAQMGDKTLSKDSRHIIGVGMIPRGEVGIIVAAYGLSSGAMSNELYAVVVIMAVATTIIAPPLLAKAFRKKYPPEYKITPDDLV